MRDVCVCVGVEHQKGVVGCATRICRYVRVLYSRRLVDKDRSTMLGELVLDFPELTFLSYPYYTGTEDEEL